MGRGRQSASVPSGGPLRILVVSPYPPRRCGIGSYARDQVARLRAAGYRVTVLSPPDSDGDLRARFLGGAAFIRAARLGRRFDRIVVHFQPALYYRPRAPVSKVLTSAALLVLALMRGPRLEVLVHEADPPVRRRPDYLLLAWALRLAGRLSFHTESERRQFERQYRGKVRGAVVPHRVNPAHPVTREEARRRLGLEGDGPLFVCPGFLHPGKGFERAIGAVEVARGDGAAPRLYVVGAVREHTPENEAYSRDLRDRADRVPGVTLLERFADDEEFDLWVAAADRVVLPYRRSWSSGILARAHALGTPAIVAAVGGLPEQAREGDVLFEDDDGLVRAMRQAVVELGSGGGRVASNASTRGEGSADGSPRPGRGRRRSDWDPEVEAFETRKGGHAVLIGLILISVALAALAQLTLKHGMNQVTHQGTAPLSLHDPMDTARRIVLNVSVWTGLVTFAVSAAVWLVVLSRASLSFAYPFASITYVLILVFDRFVLRQPISGLRYAGVALIVSGLLLISRTSPA